MKKVILFLAAALALSACSREEEVILPEENEQETGMSFMLQVRAAAMSGDSIYGSTSEQILFFVTNTSNQIVDAQFDMGDGIVKTGKEILHKYTNGGIYTLRVTVTGTSTRITKFVKIAEPAVKATGTIIQLSGKVVADRAEIQLLCKKDKIYNSANFPGKYYIKGDMNDWAQGILASDTAYVYEGNKYALFTISVKLNNWTAFGYYKLSNSGADVWAYDPPSEYWEKERQLFKFYVNNEGKISPSIMTADIPGSTGDVATDEKGPTIRLSYQTGAADSLIVFANKAYLGTEASTMGVGYSVDGKEFIIKKGEAVSGGKYIYVKVPVNKNSKVLFKTYTNIYTKATGDMTKSLFYRPAYQDCYLTIAGSQMKVSRSGGGGSGSSIRIIAPNGTSLNM